LQSFSTIPAIIVDMNGPDSSSDRLALLYQLSQTFNSSLDLDEVLNNVMDEVVAAMRAERGFLMLREPNGQLGFRAARGMDQKTIDDPVFQISRSTVERVAQEGKPVITSDAQADSRFSGRHSVVMLGLRSIMCAPLKVKENTIGVVYVDNRLAAGIFSQADLDLLNAIASSAAVAIENARLYQVAVEKGRMERELQMARKVQANLLPAETPHPPGWEISAFWQPAREVGGDYYDFISLRTGQLGLLIADVTDKGMPAALFMASTRSIVRASMAQAVTPADGLARANSLMCLESSDALFVTMFYGLLNPDTGEFIYVNAGQNPPLLFQQRLNNGQGGLRLLEFTGIPLGVEENTQYQQESITLEPGDFVVLYTDGVTDAINLNDEDFGIDQLKAVLLAHQKASAADLLTAISYAIQDHAGGRAPFDDITLVAVKYL
jgi:serine phosphatase RsbU (regulator of sigma subunit)